MVDPFSGPQAEHSFQWRIGISRGENTQDIFVHMETLRRAGMPELKPGQPVKVKIGKGPKGPQVAEISG